MSSPPSISAGLYLAGEVASSLSDSSAEAAGLAGGTAVIERLPLMERERQFAQLVDRHSRLMFRVAFSLLRNPHDAEDAVQEAFLKLYRGEAWRRMEDEKAFLARTVWRVALDRLPKGREQALEALAEPTTSELDSPEASAICDAKTALLRKMIDALPEDLCRVVVLSAIEELNSREIAEMLGIPEGTVRTRLMRARVELKRRYESAKEVRR